MKTISRRRFLGTSAMGIFAAHSLTFDVTRLHAEPFNWPMSFQSWGMKDMLGRDFIGTLRKIRALGYKGVEMCSPKGYEKIGFGPLTSLSVAELRKKIQDADMFCKTCHFMHWQLRGDELQNTIQYGKELGLKDLVISSAALSEEATLDEWKEVADEINKSGEVVQKAGLQLVYHNHTIGPVLDGEPLYDHLMRLFDPKLIKMQFQIASIAGGYDVIAYLAKYPGRYISLHMHDWDPIREKIVPIGQGVVDWKKLLNTAKESGISDYGMIVEIESKPPDDPFEGLKSSYTYLSALKF